MNVFESDKNDARQMVLSDVVFAHHIKLKERMMILIENLGSNKDICYLSIQIMKLLFFFCFFLFLFVMLLSFKYLFIIYNDVIFVIILCVDGDFFIAYCKSKPQRLWLS